MTQTNSTTRKIEEGIENDRILSEMLAYKVSQARRKANPSAEEILKEVIN